MDKDVLQIEIPEGYELDKENSTSFNVKFKKKEENEEPLAFGSNEKNLFIDLKHAKSALAMAQISQLMPYYGGAITDEEWANKDLNKKCITRYGDNILMQNCILTHQLLTFHTIEQAEAFLKYNKQLVYDYLMLDTNE